MRSHPLVLLAMLVACGGKPGASPDAAPNPDAPIDAGGSSVDPRPGLANLPPVCSDSGWCWNAPTPSGTAYSWVVSSTPDNIWIIGGGPPGYAAILQWNGSMWIEHKPPVGPSDPEFVFPMAISTIAQDNTWLLYGNYVEHWNGTTWLIDYTNSGAITLNGVWVDPNGDAWVTTSDGKVRQFHDDQVVLTLMTGIYNGAIWGTAPDDFFISSIGALLHYDGVTFTKVFGGKTIAWAQGVKNDVWFGGDTVAHWDGTTVTDLNPGLPANATIISADYAGSNDVTWLSNGDSFAPAYLMHWDGIQIIGTPIDAGSTPLEDNICAELNASKIVDGRWIIVCGSGDVMTMTGASTLTPLISPWVGAGTFWGASMSDLYMGTGWGLRHFDGVTWTDLNQPIQGLVGIPGGGGNGADELFGSHMIYTGSDSTYTYFVDHYDGSAWTSLQATQSVYGNTATSVYGAWPLGPGEAMYVGQGGTAFRYQNGTLTPITTGTANDLAAVWGPDADHLSITGANGTLLSWVRTNPTVFTPDPSMPVNTDYLGDIAFAGTTEWILAANQDYAYRRVGSGAWQTVNTITSPQSIVALSDTDVVVDGNDSGFVSRWNGSAFALETYPSWNGLQHLYGLPDGTMLLNGENGFVSHPPPAAPAKR